MRQCARTFVMLVVAVLGCGTAFGATTILSSVSSDSVPGWRPARDEQNQALTAARRYFAAVDHGSYAKAYAMLADSMKAMASEPDFEVNERAFSAKAGPAIERRATAITWTNHAEGTSNPGIFAAIDYVERYKNIDRACSYLVLVEAADGSGLRVLRTQTGSLDNATAADIAAKQSEGAVDRAWHALARQYPHCPA